MRDLCKTVCGGIPGWTLEPRHGYASLLRWWEWTLLAFRKEFSHLRIGNEDSQIEMLQSPKSVSIKAILKESVATVCFWNNLKIKAVANGHFLIRECN